VPNLAVVASSSLTAVGRADRVSRDCLESRLEWQLNQLPRVAMGVLVSWRRVWDKGEEGLVVARVVASSSSSSLASAGGSASPGRPDWPESQRELQRDRQSVGVVAQGLDFWCRYRRERCCGVWCDSVGMLIVFAAAALLLGTVLCSRRYSCR